VGAWSFDEASGTTVYDSSGNQNTGTVSGAARVAGKYGRALKFDGVNDMVSIADSASLDLSTAMTLEAWVKPTAAGSMWRTVLLKEQPSQLAYGLYASDARGMPSGHVFTTRQWAVESPSALPNAWRHLATTYDGTTMRIYVDGTQVYERAASGAITNSAGALRIGGNKVWNEWFKGLIDEVRIYNRALTAAQLQSDRTTAVGSSKTMAAQTLTIKLAGTAQGTEGTAKKARSKKAKAKAKAKARAKAKAEAKARARRTAAKRSQFWSWFH
jgi:hypothetical protein